MSEGLTIAELSAIENLRHDMIEKIDSEIVVLNKKIDNKVDWKHFTWIISTIIGLYLVISAVIYSDLKEVKVKSDATAMGVNSIEVILKQADISK